MPSSLTTLGNPATIPEADMLTERAHQAPECCFYVCGAAVHHLIKVQVFGRNCRPLSSTAFGRLSQSRHGRLNSSEVPFSTVPSAAVFPRGASPSDVVVEGVRVWSFHRKHLWEFAGSIKKAVYLCTYIYIYMYKYTIIYIYMYVLLL